MILYMIIFVFVFLNFNIGIYLVLPMQFEAFTVCYVWLLEFLAIGLSFEISEALLVLTSKPKNLPKLSKSSQPRVALLILTCDDFEIESIFDVRKQNYSNLDFFVLDDSVYYDSKSQINRLPFTIIRRQNRSGYKAGNLNHWLSKYGDNYKYFVILDADSKIPIDFVSKMVEYAEHKKNEAVAVFESLIRPWNGNSPFVRIQTIMQPIQHRAQLSIGNKFDYKFSSGHNNLLRTSAIEQVGGFNELYISEDHALSIELLCDTNWKIKTVPIISYERSPSNIIEYSKRESRWAAQTFQLLTLKPKVIPLNVRILTLKMFFHYSLYPLIPIILIIISYHQITRILVQDTYYNYALTYNKILAFWLTIIGIQYVLRSALTLTSGIKIQFIFINSVFYIALVFSSISIVVKRLLKYFIDGTLIYNVTGTSKAPRLIQIVKLNLPAYLLTVSTLSLILFNPIHSFLNLCWLLLATLSPLILFRLQGNNRI